MTFSLRASEGVSCASDSASRPSRFSRLTASIGLVSCATAAFVAFGSLAARAGTHSHHDDDSRSSRSSSHAHAKHHEDAEDHAPRGAKRHPALVKVSTAKLRETPGATGKTTALLDAGRSAVVIGRKAGWVQLKLDSGRKGWVRHDLLDVAKSTVRDHDSGEAGSDRSERHHSRKDSQETASAERSDRHSSRSHRVTEIADAQASERRSSLRHAEYAERAEHAENVRRHQQAVAALAAASSAASAHHNHSRVVHSVIAVATPAPHPVHIAVAAPAPRTVSSLPDSTENDSEMLADGEAGVPTATFAANHSHDEVRVADLASVTRAGSNPRGERVVRKALSYRGTPYRMGATGNGAFDCSGFTMYLFGKEGSSLPRTAAEQYDRGQAVSKDQLQLGDLVFFRNTYKSGISHVGIYIGNNSFVHASGYGRGVRVDKLSGAFYINHWAGARRPH